MLTNLITRYNVADEVFRRAVDKQDDPEKEWEAVQAAEIAIIQEPCRSLDEIQAKVRLVLDNENIFHGVWNCYIGEEYALTVFLRSLLGDLPFREG